ncbi:MAG: hypothetical protein IJS32_04865 [Kiritimatiellae bacterium]|nr:hypothetical protein [Kiritimatiellia bacterium]
MSNILLEENGRYGLDCTKALWASGAMHDHYVNSLHPNCLGDVDFVVETAVSLLLVEYKNAKFAPEPGESTPKTSANNVFKDQKFTQLVRKYFGSLPYLRLVGKTIKPCHYIFVVEYPNDNSTSRKQLRNRLKNALPFELQKQFGSKIKLIEAVDVVNIDEWNSHPVYGQFPLKPVKNLMPLT